MWSFEKAARAWCTSARLLLVLASSLWAVRAEGQGFAVERLYQSAPGGGWFVMDDLNIDGGWAATVAITSGYAHKPFEVVSPDGAQRLAVVSDEAFLDVGVATTYRRFRVYVNVPIPLLVTGQSGTIGSLELVAPDVNVATNPDSIVDPRIGFDIRVFGQPRDALRIGIGTQLIIPSGRREDYVTDGTARAMVRLLAAGDRGTFSYAGQIGVHVRPLDDSPEPGGPTGNELLFGASAGRSFSLGRVVRHRRA
jgi:hypothetical protein